MKGLFKLSTLAISVFAASQVSAIELYNNEGTTANMYGAVAAQVSSYDYDKSTIIGNDAGFAYNSDQTHVEDPGSWFGFDIKHQMGSVYGVAKLEWDVDFLHQPILIAAEDSLHVKPTLVLVMMISAQ